MSRNKEIENINKIKNAITGLMADSMFKKKNGKWNSIKIAEYLKIDSRTVRKYLAELPN
jgi:Mn-dependent DtxR family transcriptional regulator